MRKLLLLITLPLFGNVPLNTPIDPPIISTGNVNVITGVFSEVSTDHVVRCLEPIPIQRFYSSTRLEGHFGKSRFERHQLREISKDRIELEEPDGTVFIFNPNTGKMKIPHGTVNTSSGSIGGKTNLKNWRMVKQKDDTFLLTKGNGERSLIVLLHESTYPQYPKCFNGFEIKPDEPEILNEINYLKFRGYRGYSLNNPSKLCLVHLYPDSIQRQLMSKFDPPKYLPNHDKHKG